MGIAEAFRDHLRSLSDDEWNQLVAEVRPPNPESHIPLPNEVEQSGRIGTGRNEGLAEAKRRGYIQ
ncbi:hypothetical protein [Mycobacterium sp. 1423905.2]|uniref:hypothetical protein n=1 Tax=Mycobacterium sp. 1423905.2 TaxID=1856859 RepID=UPI000801748F|nr:hypothetical protein [Mycobacterium sp. 1423905.2]OBJ49537.1 hypothetical protein A9W95_25570 [Mycobacterium sp. 1423905.2]